MSHRSTYWKLDKELKRKAKAEKKRIRRAARHNKGQADQPVTSLLPVDQTAQPEPSESK